MSDQDTSYELKHPILVVYAGEYQSLKNEVERLRTGLALSSNNKFHKRSASAASSAHSNAAIWSMLDMRKLDLNWLY